MGFNTTVVIMNDALGAIERDPDFGKNLCRAVREVYGNEPVDVSALGHCNAATVIESHHADQTAVLTVGGNYGTLQAMSWGHVHHNPKEAERHLRVWAAKLGFSLRRNAAS